MDDSELRTQLANLLAARQAHALLEDAVRDLPEEHIDTKPPGCPYSFWQLLEHMRICQRDILDYIEADHYRWLSFPADLWPRNDARSDPAGWQRTIDRFLADRQRLIDIVGDPATDLFAPLPNSGEHRHTIVREIHVVAAHNAYHTGELIVMRRSLGLWP